MAMACRCAVVAVLAATIVAGAGPSASAQTSATTADLSGVVCDQSSAVLPGATVTARNAATGLLRSVATGSDGRYLFTALPPALYSVTAALDGFVAMRAENVALVLGEAAKLDFVLRIGGTKEEVTVIAEPIVAAAGQSAVAAVISTRQLETLPSNGRNFISNSLLTPGSYSDRTPTQGASATSGLVFAGQRARSNNINVDGLDNNDIMTGGVRATFSQEAVQEFQVMANSFPAEFGKALGGIVNIVTKSGANTTSGNFFAFFRDDALNAKEHFEKYDANGAPLDQAKAPYRRAQFGGMAGGPIRRDRAFFFLSAESLRTHANNFVNIDNTTQVNVGGVDRGTLVDILRAYGFPVEIGQVPYRVDSDQFLAKVDTVLTSAHRLAVRINWARLLDENAEPWGGQVARSAGASLESHDLMGALLLTSTLSPRTVNELRLQVAGRDQIVASLDPTCHGACDQNDEGGPEVDVGAVRVGRQLMTPQPRETWRYQVVDTLTHSMGRHQLKAGLDGSYIDIRSLALPMTFGGRYVFQPIGSLTTEQALALGRPFYYVQGYGNPGMSGAVTDISLFAEDEWRARESLTLRLGVRYQNQFWPPMSETVGNLSYSWPADNNNVAPRLAASWLPFGNEKTSVHGAYGIFYDNHIAAVWGVPYIISGTADHLRLKTVPAPDSWNAWNAPGRKVPEPTTPGWARVMTIDPGLRSPYAHHAAIGFDRSLTRDLRLSARFVYVRGIGQVGAIEYNPVIDPATKARPLDTSGPGSSGSVWQLTSWADSWYRGLTISVGKRFTNRYELQASYTLSKAEDLATDYSFSTPQYNGLGRDPANPTGLPTGFNPMVERGLSLQDQRHRLVLSGVYELPKGFTVSGVVTAGSGRPYNILADYDMNGDGDKTSDRPRTSPSDPATSIGRNLGLLPGTSAVDLRVAKRIPFGDRVKLDLMFETFNLFDHTNYTGVDAVFGNKAYPGEPLRTFGRFTTAAPPFQAQLGTKLWF